MRPRFFRILRRIPADCSNRAAQAACQGRSGVVGLSSPASRVCARRPACRRRPRSPLPGVHSFSRACACSTVIGCGLAHQQIDRLAAATSSRRASRRPALRSCSTSSAGSEPSRSATGRRRLQSSSSVGLDRLGLDDRRQHRLAAQRRGGLGLGLVGQLLLVLAGDPQVGRPWRCPAVPAREQSAPAARGRVRGPARPARVDRRPRRRPPPAPPPRTRARPRARRPRRSACGDVLAQLGERVEARRPRPRSRRRARAGAWP